MYTPKKFRIADVDQIRSFVDQNGFGLLISTTVDGEIETTPTPMFLSADLQTVYGHIAKANPQWKSWVGGKAVRILFNGPHTYISPRDYASQVNVPTWNYTAVSIDGEIEILENQQKQEWLIDSLVDQYESSAEDPWSLDKSNSKLTNLFNAIVCFQVKVGKLDAKFKLNQNKSIEDQKQVIDRLQQRSADFDHEIAEMMKNNLK